MQGIKLFIPNADHGLVLKAKCLFPPFFFLLFLFPCCCCDCCCCWCYRYFDACMLPQRSITPSPTSERQARRQSQHTSSQQTIHARCLGGGRGLLTADLSSPTTPSPPLLPPPSGDPASGQWPGRGREECADSSVVDVRSILPLQDNRWSFGQEGTVKVFVVYLLFLMGFFFFFCFAIQLWSAKMYAVLLKITLG